MEAFALALLFGAALWMGDLYNAGKFRFFYPELTPDLLPKEAARWKRVWVYRNQPLKHAGLFTIWAGVTLGAYRSNATEAAHGRAFYAVALLGFLLYLASRLWPALLQKGRRRR